MANGRTLPKRIISNDGKGFHARVFVGFGPAYGPRRQTVSEAQADVPGLLERQRKAAARRKSAGLRARPRPSKSTTNESPSEAERHASAVLTNACYFEEYGGKLPPYVRRHRSKFRASVCIGGRTVSGPARLTVPEAASDVPGLLRDQWLASSGAWRRIFQKKHNLVPFTV